MKVFIPSYDRSDVIFSKPELTAMVMESFGQHVVVCVRGSQLISYRKAAKAAGFKGDVVKVPRAAHAIAAKRAWIGKLAATYGDDTFMIADDDCVFARRVDTDSTKLTREDLELDCMMDHIEEWLFDGAAHVGVSLRQGNNNYGPCDWEEVAMNERICRVAAFRTEVFNACEHGRVQWMSDFEIALQILRMGYDNCNLMWWAQDQAGTQTPGGCSTARTVANHRRSVLALQALHPEFVSVRQKQNKTGGKFGKRTEATIYWKKARLSANA